MLCSSITEVQVVCSTSKARTQRRSADREKSEFVGPSDSWTKQSAAVDDLLSKSPEHRGPPSSSGLHRVGTSTPVLPSGTRTSCELMASGGLQEPG